MADYVSSQVKSLIKYELDIDEDRDNKTREPIVVHSCSQERAPPVKDASKISDSKLNNFSLNQDRIIKNEVIEIDEPVVYKNKEDLVETPKNIVLSEANDVRLNISSENIPLEVNNSKDQVQGQQIPLKAAEIANQVKTSEEYQETCRVLCKDQLQTLNSANRLSDTSKGQVIVLEPPTKRLKTEQKFYGEFEAEKTINKLSPPNDVSLNFEVAGSGEIEVDTKQVSNVQIVDNSKDNIGEVQQNTAPVYSHGKEADEDSCEIVYEKNITNKRNHNYSSCNVQPVKKVLLVQIDQKTVSEILTGSSSRVKLPIVNLQNNLTLGNNCSSGSKAHDNCVVGSARMPMNLPTPQPDVSATTRSMEDPSTVCVPECETFPAVNAIGKSQFFFVDVDGS
ncbi:hypothetical protein KQX54_003361 [Cotesia glomerata]|uniref:Uncharacterized protein n=1 Tax=Cotesia glomerata TaxID=32391 RepID=A0AAV7HHB9_COTGL|nr:hypothetical protein KQX54_003361 [Cotesia glomerata]